MPVPRAQSTGSMSPAGPPAGRFTPPGLVLRPGRTGPRARVPPVRRALFCHDQASASRAELPAQRKPGAARGNLRLAPGILSRDNPRTTRGSPACGYRRAIAAPQNYCNTGRPGMLPFPGGMAIRRGMGILRGCAGILPVPEWHGHPARFRVVWASRPSLRRAGRPHGRSHQSLAMRQHTATRPPIHEFVAQQRPDCRAQGRDVAMNPASGDSLRTSAAEVTHAGRRSHRRPACPNPSLPDIKPRADLRPIHRRTAGLRTG